MPRKKSTQPKKNAEPSMRRQSNRVAAAQAAPTIDGTESNSVAVNNSTASASSRNRNRNHIIVYILVYILARSFVQPHSGLRNHRVLIATPHQETQNDQGFELAREQCPLNLQCGLAYRGVCRSNCCS
jgi:hypothetical protein